MADKSNTRIYEIPRSVLSPLPDPSVQLTSQISNEINKQEDEIVKKQIRVPFETKLINLLNNKKENIKGILIPFIVNLLLEFGTTAAQDAINNKKAATKNCPSSAKIKIIIKKRNKLVKQLNNLYKTVTTISTVLKVTNVIIVALQIGIQIAKIIPYPSIGIPPLGLPPVTVGLQNIASDSLQKLQDLLKAAGVSVNILTIAVGTLGIFLGIILNYLKSLDSLLQQCAVDQNMDLEQLNNEINALANSTVTVTQSENNTYKGFALEVKINEKNTSKYIQRYAQALNKQGVPVLKTEPSFASDPSVLISQLKFIIDSNPNLTAE
jgi:hypothetical protein